MAIGHRFTFAVLTAALLSTPALAQGNSGSSPGHVADELLVKVQPGALSKVGRTHRAVGARVLRTYEGIGWQRVKLPPGLSVGAAIGLYRRSTDIVTAEPNGYAELGATPNDPTYPDQWGLPQIEAPAAWDLTTGSAGVVVAIIDSGVRYTHMDLKDDIWVNPDETPGNGVDDDGNGYVDDVYGIDAVDNDTNPLDTQSHGTWIAGVVGAEGNNGRGIAGVNWNVRMMPLKFTNSQATGTVADAITCYQYATMMKQRGVNIRVINNSWAASFSQALKDAVDAAGNAGILSVCASMNKSVDIDTAPVYPACYASPSIICVGASTSTDAPASFTNFGGTNVDLAAPGVAIWTTTNSSNNAYISSQGSSFSTAFVSGAAALLAAHVPSLSMTALKSLILDSVDVIPSWNGKSVTSGRLNIARAMSMATQGGLDHLSFATQPGGAEAGQSLSPQPQVRARDANGATVTSFNGPVTVTIKAGTGTSGASLSGTTTLNAVNGVASFTNLTIDTAGTGYVLRASGGGFTVDSQAFDITAPTGGQTPTKVAFIVQPGSAQMTIPFGTQPQVAVQDAGGATVTSFNGPVTVAIQTGTGATGAVLSGTTTLNAVNGVASFTNLTIDRAGTGYRLQATSAGLTSASSALFDVAQVAYSAKFSIMPGSGVAGQPLSVQPQVRLRDVNGYVATNYNGPVTLTIQSGTGTPGAQLTGTTTVNAVNGYATFTNIGIDTAGSGYRLLPVVPNVIGYYSNVFDIAP